MSGSDTSAADREYTVALAHWHSQSWGGAEYLVTKLAEALDLEEVYTIGTPDSEDPNPYGEITWIDVTEGISDRVRRKFGRAGEYALWEDIDWRSHGDPDILLTSGSTTRAVITPDDTLHVNYCHSPPRWLYDLYHDRKASRMGRLARPALRYFRLRDQSVDPRVDAYLANSPIISRRLWKFYKRDSTVLYPPLELGSYYYEPAEDFFLHLGRLDTEKGVEEVVEAFESRGDRLVFAGGRGDVDDSVVKRIRTAPNMEYLGFVEESRKYELLATCRAVVFNGVNEDFGIVPIEANASGKPCLVRDDGFPEVFIEEGENGVIHDGNAASILDAIDQFEASEFDPDSIQSSVIPFSFDAFERRLHDILEELYVEFQTQSETVRYEEK